MKTISTILLLTLVLALCCCTQNNNTERVYEPSSTTTQSTTPTTLLEAPVKGTSNCITADESWDKIGEKLCVEYTVVNAYQSKGGNIFLNEKSDYKTGFTTTIFASSASKFSDPLNTYNQKTIQVTGLIKLYDGHPEIIAEKPEQIKIIS